MPTNVDGTFVAVGGAGLIPFLKAYEQAHGPIDGKKFIGNLFWGTPGQFEQLGDPRRRRLRRRRRHGRRSRHARRRRPTTRRSASVFKTIPPFGAAAPQAASTFTYGFYVNTWGLIKGLKAVKRRHLRRPEEAAGGDRKVELDDAVRPDQAGQEPPGDHQRLLPAALHEGRQAGSQDGRRDPERRPDVRRHVLRDDAGAGTHVPGLREADPAVDRQEDPPEGHRLATR